MALLKKKSKGDDAPKAEKPKKEKIEKKGNEPDLLYNRGRCFEELGETEKAKADYHQVLSLNKRHVNARLSLAGIAYQAGNYSRVIILTDKLLEYQEKSAEAHFLQARAKHQLGQAQSALESYTAAISLNDEFGEAYLYRGAVKNSMKFKSACDDFKKAELLGVEGAEKAVEENCR